MMVKEYKPDLIILDVMLPDINGKYVCVRVRSDKALETVKIVCVSGIVEEDKITWTTFLKRKLKLLFRGQFADFLS